MSKVICDICGTSFPDAATQCPICGSVRPADAPSVTEDGADKTSGYKHVKGGNFSKANVRKRNKAKGVVSVNVVSDMDNDEEDKRKSNKPLIIVAAVLMLAIIAVATYIVLAYFGPSANTSYSDVVVNQENSEHTTSTEQSEVISIPCTDVTLDVESIVFNSDDSARMIYPQVQPIDSTDELIFASDNEDVAIVNTNGMVTPVGPGTATITVICGEYQATCVVECVFSDETESTENTEETVDATEESTVPAMNPNSEFKLNRVDITFSRKGESWVIYSGSIPLSAITWSSDNEEVASIQDGKVVAVGPGDTKVYGEYNNQKVGCIIRCYFSTESENDGVTGNGGGVSEDGGSVVSGGNFNYYSQWGPIAGNDASISVGDILQLTLKDGAGNPVSVEFSVSGSSCTVNGNSVTGTAAGDSIVSCVYQGVTYECTIRVH